MPAQKGQPERTPEYLKTHKLRGKQLQFSLKDEARTLIEKARESRTGRTAKTLVKEGRLRLTLVALRGDGGIRRHSIDGPHSIHVLQGTIELHRGGHKTRASAGGVVVFDAGVKHDIHARRDAVFLITLSFRAASSSGG